MENGLLGLAVFVGLLAAMFWEARRADVYHVIIRGAFNYKQREEMKVMNRTGMSGFSLGLGLHLKKFQFQYGFNAVSAAGFNNMFTLSTNINEWKK